MQILKDAMALLGMLLLVASVRVTRVEPVHLDLVPAVHAAEAAAIETPGVPTEIKLPVAVPARIGEANLDTLTVEPRVLRSCETQVFRFKDSSKREVLAIAIETSPKLKAAPRACKIG